MALSNRSQLRFLRILVIEKKVSTKTQRRENTKMQDLKEAFLPLRGRMINWMIVQRTRVQFHRQSSSWTEKSKTCPEEP